MRGNPKTEIRNPKEGRNPKAEWRSCEPGAWAARFGGFRPSNWRRSGFRISVFGFPSVFGFRFSDLGLRFPLQRP